MEELGHRGGGPCILFVRPFGSSASTLSPALSGSCPLDAEMPTIQFKKWSHNSTSATGHSRSLGEMITIAVVHFGHGLVVYAVLIGPMNCFASVPYGLPKYVGVVRRGQLKERDE